MYIKIKVEKIVILSGYGTDLLCITTDSLNNGVWPFDGGQTIKIEIAKNHSREWLKNNLGEKFLSIVETIDIK